MLPYIKHTIQFTFRPPRISILLLLIITAMHSMFCETRLLVSNRVPVHVWWESMTGFPTRHYVVWVKPDSQPQKNSSTGFPNNHSRYTLREWALLTRSLVSLPPLCAIRAHNALLSCRAFISQIIRVFRDTGELPEHVYRTGARFL